MKCLPPSSTSSPSSPDVLTPITDAHTTPNDGGTHTLRLAPLAFLVPLSSSDWYRPIPLLSSLVLLSLLFINSLFTLLSSCLHLLRPLSPKRPLPQMTSPAPKGETDPLHSLFLLIPRPPQMVTSVTSPIAPQMHTRHVYCHPIYPTLPNLTSFSSRNCKSRARPILPLQLAINSP